MPSQPGSMHYTQGFGSSPDLVSFPHLDVRAPASTDIQYPVGKIWTDTVNNASYQLTSFSVSSGITSATWVALGGGSSAVATLSGDTGTAVPSSGNIKIAGTANQIVTSASGSTVTLALTGPYTPATYTAHGVLVGEGTSSIAAISPSATSGVALISQGASADPAYGTVVVAGGGTGATTLTGVLTGNGTSAVTANAVTQHGVLLGGASNAVSSLGVAATGTVLMGSTGADPAFTATPSGLTSLSAGTLSATTTITAGTTLTATLGNITATNGNLVLSSAGNKIDIHATTAASDSVGIGTLNGSGTVTISTTACTTSSKVFCQIVDPSGVGSPGILSVPSATILNGSFVVNSSIGTDASTFFYWIIN